MDWITTGEELTLEQKLDLLKAAADAFSWKLVVQPMQPGTADKGWRVYFTDSAAEPVYPTQIKATLEQAADWQLDILRRELGKFREVVASILKAVG